MHTLLISTCPYFISFKILNICLKFVIVETLCFILKYVTKQSSEMHNIIMKHPLILSTVHELAGMVL